jgi:hypothetical protein
MMYQLSAIQSPDKGWQICIPFRLAEKHAQSKLVVAPHN